MLKNLLKLSLIAGASLLLAACATTQNYQQTLAQWQGENIQRLIQVWGYPDAGVKLPNGNSVYMYTNERSYVTPATPMATPTIINVPGSQMAATSYNGGFIGGKTLTLYCRTWFETDPKGIIVNYRFLGNNCIASKHNQWTPAN